jgi:hypothetical protein
VELDTLSQSCARVAQFRSYPNSTFYESFMFSGVAENLLAFCLTAAGTSALSLSNFEANSNRFLRYAAYVFVSP